MHISSTPPHQKKSRKFALIHPVRIPAYDTGVFDERKCGITEYLKETGSEDKILEVRLPFIFPDECKHAMAGLFATDPEIGGIAVLDSRGHVVAGILSEMGITGIPVIAFDMTSGNRKCLEAGTISAIICQYPEIQGYNSVKSAIQYLLYRKKDGKRSHKMPIGIIVAENLPYYKSFNGM